MNTLDDARVIVNGYDNVQKLEIEPSFYCFKIDTAEDALQNESTTTTTTTTQQSAVTEFSSTESIITIKPQLSTTQKLTSNKLIECSEETRELKSLERLYGREEEQKIILQTYQQTIHQNPTNPSFLIIQGEEGIGKTFLVEQTLSKHVRLHDGGFFVHWRLQNVSLTPNFESVSPDDGFEDAFASLTNQIITANESVLDEIKDNFLQNMNENDRLILAEMIPCLVPLLGLVDGTESKCSNVHGSGRQMQIFINMLRIIARPERPLVLFLDNVHHADACNVRLLECLLEDTESQGLLYVISLDRIQSDDIQKFVLSFENRCPKTRTAVSISLSPLDGATTHCMVADMLHIDLETSGPLHASLESYIRGNPRCLNSLMQWMYLNQYLRWETSTKTWHWNTHELLHCHEHERTPRTSWSKLPSLVQKLLQGAFKLRQ
jgi:predicted ATPase